MFEEGHTFLCIQGGFDEGHTFLGIQGGFDEGHTFLGIQGWVRRGTLSCCDLISWLAFGIMHKVVRCVSFGL